MERAEVLKGDDAAPAGLPREDWVRVYQTMRRVRLLDERALKLQRQGRIGFSVASTGEEALQVGSVHALSPRDWLFPSYRSTGLFLYRGVTYTEVFHNLFGTARDPVLGRQMPNHFACRERKLVSISSPIGTQIPQAVGAALAARYRGDDAIAAVYFGEGGTSSNDFHSGMNFAGVLKAPVIFFCNNNQYAISLPFHQQTASASVAVKAEAYGFEGVGVDGNDVLAVYDVMRGAVAKARAGKGPTLIEAITYRVAPHSSSDDPSRYRSAEEVEAWVQRDPIRRFRAVMEEQGLWSEAQEVAFVEEEEKKIRAALKEVESAGPPDTASMFRDVHRELTPDLRKQQRDLEAYLQRKGEIEDRSEAFPL